MPPRPRPKPKPKAVVPSNAVASSSTAEVDDAAMDAMFTKNKTRSLQTWKKLDEISKVNSSKTNKRHGSDSNDSSDDDGDSPRSKKQKRTRRQSSAVPAWQREKNINRLLSVEPLSDNDSDVELVESPTNKGKRKRPRDRSSRSSSRNRSLTPPPILAASDIEATRSIVRRALAPSPRKGRSRDSDDEFDTHDTSTDTIYLDPDLAKIALSVKQRAKASQSSFSYDRSQPSVADNSSDDTVDMTVKWLPHPQRKEAQERTFVFKVLRNQNLGDMFDATAEEASILETSLVVLHKAHRVFSSVSPADLKIWNKGEFIACDKGTWDWMRKQTGGINAFLGGAGPLLRDETPPRSFDLDNDDDVQQEKEEEEADDSFNIVLRSASTKDVKLRVRPTTKCRLIVAAFMKKATLPASLSPRKKAGKDVKLSVDGDRMGDDVEIGEADLEDGDVVEIVGL